MKCPLCGYMMDAFDLQCPRCKGQGLPNAPQQQAAPAPSPTTPATPPPDSTVQNAPAHYGKSCPHCGAAMAFSMQYCPICHKNSNEPKGDQARGASPQAKGALIFGVLFTLLFGSFFGYRYWTRTPQYSLWQAKRALSAHDLDTFEKYVDIDSCVDGFVDDLLDEVKAQAKATEGMNTPEQEQAQKFVEGLIVAMKSTLTTYMKKQVRTAVEKGAESAGGGDNGPGFSLDDLTKKSREQGIEFSGFEYIKKQGDVAYIGLKFQDTEEKKESFVIELKSAWEDDHWRVKRWSNVHELVEQMKELGLEQPTLPKASESPIPGGGLPSPGESPTPGNDLFRPPVTDPRAPHAPSRTPQWRGFSLPVR